MRTFFVTPGAARGRHLSHNQLLGALPDLGDGHWLIHVAVQSVALLSCEDVEYLDAAIALTSRDILVVGVKTDAEGLLRGIAQGVFVGDLDF